jgi:hypothetical protein
MTPESDLARTAVDASKAVTAAAGPFVINLCSSTTPMALRIPDAPGLKRFSFFVSRRREEGRERFRLHMGHFASLAEAEEWLRVVRDIYPGAWAGEAPGKKLRAAEAADPRPFAPPTPAPAPVTAPASTLAVPVITSIASSPALVAPPGAPAQATATAPPPAAMIPVVEAAKLRSAAAPPTVAPAPPPPVRLPQSNVREVLADLEVVDDSEATQRMPIATRLGARTALAPGAELRAEEPGLTDTQVLGMLEQRRDEAATGTPQAAEEIELLRPDDVSTMTELRRGLHANGKLSFAVQLEWSVQPIDLKRVPPLAIFSAYTLYTVEGNREGRRWYGLRLGFFSDSLSAKQVALYVRSEFKSVAVIPVSGREKLRAVEEGRLSTSALGHEHHREKPAEEFKLLDEPAPRRAPSARPTEGGGRRAARGGAGARRPAARPVTRAPARRKTLEETLEETLEILGAGQLRLDDGRKPFINDNDLLGRESRAAAETGTGTFAKLLDRLSDRLIRGR